MLYTKVFDDDYDDDYDDNNSNNRVMRSTKITKVLRNRRLYNVYTLLVIIFI
jgi:hypothetical protein